MFLYKLSLFKVEKSSWVKLLKCKTKKLILYLSINYLNTFAEYPKVISNSIWTIDTITEIFKVGLSKIFWYATKNLISFQSPTLYKLNK